MAVTIYTKKSVEISNEDDEGKHKEDLLWLHSLRQLLPSVGELNNRWSKMSATACKLYITMWDIETMPKTLLVNEPHISHLSLKLYSGLNEKVLQKALLELEKQELIRIYNVAEGVDPDYSLIYHLTPEALENGV